MLEPEATKHDGDRTDWTYNELIGRNGYEFVFLDRVFDSPSLGGAVGTRMDPITEEELERRRNQYLDPEHSPLAHTFDSSEHPDTTLAEYLEETVRIEGDRILYDPSYEHKYGDDVRQAAAQEELYDSKEIVAVECVGGGRMFNSLDSFDTIYNQDALAIAQDAEEGVFPNE